MFTINRFPSGETRVEADQTPDIPIYDTITCKNGDALDLMTIGQMADIFRAYMGPTFPLTLNLPYLPYSRQDRYTTPHSSFALKVYAKFINSLGFNRVTTLDAHSDVSGVIDNLVNQSPAPYIQRVIDRLETDHLYIVAPDAGAAKKIFEIVKQLHGAEFHVVIAYKSRDLVTGEITGIMVPHIPPDETVLVIDDICDGGRTFVELAKHLLSNDRYLFTTHGFFTKPDVFAYYNAVFCTDSVKQQHTASNLNIIGIT